MYIYIHMNIHIFVCIYIYTYMHKNISLLNPCTLVGRNTETERQRCTYNIGLFCRYLLQKRPTLERQRCAYTTHTRTQTHTYKGVYIH